MRSEDLKVAIRQSALSYAQAHRFTVDEGHTSALMFARVEDAFCPASFNAIRNNAQWFERTLKKHTQVPNAFEMQSSNSSDGLLMSIFCHPKISSWKGVSDLLGFRPELLSFGERARVAKHNTGGDVTEIDMVADNYFVEAKLTEASFTESPARNVHLYEKFAAYFAVDRLRVRNDCYCNYQVIRNVLAAAQHGKGHILICDDRRPDLVREYYATVSCVRDEQVRLNCRVVFWQEIARVSGEELARFLKDRYGIS